MTGSNISTETYKEILEGITKSLDDVFKCLEDKVSRISELISQAIEEPYFDEKAYESEAVQTFSDNLDNGLKSFEESFIATKDRLLAHSLVSTQSEDGLMSARKKRSNPSTRVTELVKVLEKNLENLVSVQQLILFLLEHTDLEAITVNGVLYVRFCVDIEFCCYEFQIKSETLGKICDALDDVAPCLKESFQLILVAKRAIFLLKQTILGDIFGFITKYIKSGVLILKDGFIFVADQVNDLGKFLKRNIWSWFGIDENNSEPPTESPTEKPIPVFPSPRKRTELSYDCPCASSQPNCNRSTTV